MFHLLSAIGVLALFAALPLALKAKPKESSSEGGLGWYQVRLAALGDSLTANAAYCSVMRDALEEVGGTAECHGYTGQGVAVVASHLNKALNTKLGPTNNLVVMVGVNDLASGRSLEKIKMHLEGLYRSVKQQGIRLIAIPVTPWRGHSKGEKNAQRTADLNYWIASHPLPDVIINVSALGDHQGFLWPVYDRGDGLHMTHEGAQDLGEMVITQAGL